MTSLQQKMICINHLFESPSFFDLVYVIYWQSPVKEKIFEARNKK